MQLTDANALSLAASSLSTLVVVANGAVSQVGALTLAGASSFHAGSGALALTQAANSFGGAVALAGGAVAVNATGALNVSSLLAGANQPVSLLATGTLTLPLAAIDTGSADLSLHSQGGTLQTQGALSGGNINLSAQAVSLAHNVSASGTLGLSASNGGITQSAGRVSVGGLATVTAGSGAISLTQASNDFQAGLDLSGGVTQVTDANALSLGSVATGSLSATASGSLNLGQGTVAGTLVASSNNGAVTQSGALTVSGAASIQAGTGAVTLTQAGNAFQGPLSLSGGTTQVVNGGALVLGSLATGSLSLSSAGALNLGQGTVGGTLSANTGGGITQSGALVVSGTSSLQAGSGAITLTQAGNDFQGAVSLSGGATQLVDANQLVLGPLAVGALTVSANGPLNLGSGSLSGGLSAISQNGAITQTGALTVAGVASVNAGSGSIGLTAANDFQGLVSLSGGSVQVSDANALSLGIFNTGTLNVVAAGSLNLGQGSTGSLQAQSTAGNITQSGALAVTGSAGVFSGGGDVTLTQASNSFGGLLSLGGGALQVVSAGSLGLASFSGSSLTVSAGGALHLGSGTVSGALNASSSGGGLSQSGALTVGGASNLNAGSGAIALGQVGNSWQGAVSLMGANTELAASGPLVLGASTVAGTFTVSSAGALTQSGALSVSGGSSFNTGAQALTLNHAGNDFQGTVNLSSGTAQLLASGALSLGTLATAGLDVRSAGALNLGQGTVAGALSARTAGSTLGQSGALTVTGTTSLVADGSPLQVGLAQAGNSFGAAVNLAALNGGSMGTVALAATGNLSVVGDAQALQASATGQISLGGGRYTTLHTRTGAGLVQTGALDVSGTSSLVAVGTAGQSADLSTQTANEWGRVELGSEAGGSWGSVRLRDRDSTRADGLRVGGDAAALQLWTGGALDLLGGSYTSLAADASAGGIGQSGVLQVTGSTLLNAGGHAINLMQAGNRFGTLGIAQAGTADLHAAQGFTVEAAQVSTRLGLSSPGLVSLAGPVSGAGALVWAGSGVLQVGSAQSHSGGTRIEAGTLAMDGGSASLGSGAVTLLTGATLDLRNGASLGNSLQAQGGSVRNSAGAATLAGAITLDSDLSLVLEPSAAGLRITGAISDGGAARGLGLAGGGTLTLEGMNSYSGATQVAAGTLRAQAGGALPSASAVDVAAGAQLVLGANQTLGSLSGAGQVDVQTHALRISGSGNTSFSGKFLGSGSLTQAGSGSLTLGGASAGFTGAVAVEAGTLVLAQAQALAASSGLSVASGATLRTTQTVSLASLTGSGNVDLQGPRLAVGTGDASSQFAGRISGPGELAKVGGGMFTLSGTNTPGSTAVEAGTLRLAVANALPAGAAVRVDPGATLDLQAAQSLGPLTGGGTVQLAGGDLTLGANGQDSTFAGAFGGSGGLIKAGSGTVTLSGRNTFSGATRVTGGTLHLSVSNALSALTAVSLDAGTALRLSANQLVAGLSGAGQVQLQGASLSFGGNGQSTQIDGLVSGSGSLVKQGSGTVTFTAANTYSGGTTIEAGSVRLAGGSPGTVASLGTGSVLNQGTLELANSGASTWANAVSGSGQLVITQGDVTLGTASTYTGATQVNGGRLITSAAEQLPDASAVQVAAGAELSVAGPETVASLTAAGQVRLGGNLTTSGDQTYTGALTVTNAQGLTLRGQRIEARHSGNNLGTGPLGLSATQALISAPQSLNLGDVSLANGGQIEAQRLSLSGPLRVQGGSLQLKASASPDDAKATPQGTVQVPLGGRPLATAEATVVQNAGSAITVASGAELVVQATGGGSVLLNQDANAFSGGLSVLSGPAFGTAWVPNVRDGFGIQSLIHIAGGQVNIGGLGVEGDLVHIRAEGLRTSATATIAARLPFDDVLLGRAFSAPGLTLELRPAAFDQAASFGATNGQEIRVAVGTTATGNRSSGNNAGYVTLLPKAGARGSTAVFLVGPDVSLSPGGYRFFHDGASKPAEVPIVYNGVLPLTPQATGALSSINGDAEDARRARFQETVRTENVSSRLRSGVIAEVGAGRPATVGREGARPPETCEPAAQPALSCK